MPEHEEEIIRLLLTLMPTTLHVFMEAEAGKSPEYSIQNPAIEPGSAKATRRLSEDTLQVKDSDSVLSPPHGTTKPNLEYDDDSDSYNGSEAEDLPMNESAVREECELFENSFQRKRRRRKHCMEYLPKILMKKLVEEVGNQRRAREETESNIGKDEEEDENEHAEEEESSEGEGEGAEDSSDNDSDPCRRPSPRIREEDDDEDNPIAATSISGIGSDRKTGIDSMSTVCPAASLSHAEQTHFAKLSGSFGARMLEKARQRGVVVSNDEDPKIRKAKKKEREVKEKKAEAWRKPGKANTKIQHKTYEEIYSLRPIIDATGAVPREVSSLADVSISSWTPTMDSTRIPKVRHNFRLIAESCKTDLNVFYRQTSEFEPELDRYRLHEVVVGAITPLVRRIVAQWQPMEDPWVFISTFRNWRRALRFNVEDETLPETQVDIYGTKTVPINQAIELGPDAPSQLPKPDYRAEQAQHALTNSPYSRLSNNGDRAKTNASSSFRPSARTQEITFRSIVKEYTASRDHLFTAAGRAHEKSRMPLFRITPSMDGKGVCWCTYWMMRLWAALEGAGGPAEEYRAISLDEVVLRSTKG
ncbi:hypothetical protein C8R41DRAFT_867215 [Lentinula lateritia]|uniref:GCF C-terminal domain-containing protein n=1 Tax=Lentinula lateritia TaxID=40482 RepID=A0ABQ8VKZ8_9AGAR|nr:hypothetical protein C8R41DRAFT_867215 [Lentinula lateritia]